MIEKINLKKITGLGLSLCLGLSIVPSNSFACAGYQDYDSDDSLSEKEQGNNGELSFRTKIKECLKRLSYDESEITLAHEELLAWNVVRKLRMSGPGMNIYFCNAYFICASVESICKSVTKEDIDQYLSEYGAKAIEDAFKSFNIDSSFYNISSEFGCVSETNFK